MALRKWRRVVFADDLLELFIGAFDFRPAIVDPAPARDTGVTNYEQNAGRHRSLAGKGRYGQFLP